MKFSLLVPITLLIASQLAGDAYGAAVPCSKKYSLKVNASGITIKSPGHPKAYEPSENVCWIFAASPGKVVTMEVTNLDVEDGHDYLLINEADENGKIGKSIAVLTGKAQEGTYTSGTREMLIQFLSDESTNLSGFELVVREDVSELEDMDQNSLDFFSKLKRPTTQCTVAAYPARERVNCGFSGISPQQCASRGCCFDSRTPGVAWCFYPASTTCPDGKFGKYCQNDASCLAIHPYQRVNCRGMPPGVTKAQCEAKGCCFDNSISGISWCFVKRDVSNVIVMDQGSKECSAALHPPKERVNCGYSGISWERCASRNCCYNDKTPNVAWCFYPEVSKCPPGKSGRFCQYGSDAVCLRTNPKLRVSCPGVQGRVTKAQCENLGCCFDNSVPDGVWCFVRKENYKMDPASAECRAAAYPLKARVDCGFPGISADLCATRGCCFNNKTKGVVWCFFPEFPVE